MILMQTVGVMYDACKVMFYSRHGYIGEYFEKLEVRRAKVVMRVRVRDTGVTIYHGASEIMRAIFFYEHDITRGRQ